MIILRSYNPDRDYKSVREIQIENSMFSHTLDSEERLKSMVIEDPGCIIVAEKDSEVVGSVYSLRTPWSGHIYRLVVRKEHQSQGIGKALLQKAEQKLWGQEVVMILGYTKDDLVDLYEEAGWRTGKTYIAMNKVIE